MCNCDFEQIFNKYRGILIFYARKLVSDQLVAEDIVTDVLVKLWYDEKKYENLTHKINFLFLCTRNECLNFLKKKKYKEKQIDNAFINEADDDIAINRITEMECILQVWNIVESLPPMCRKITLLTYLKGVNNQKIAQLLNISVHTVRNHKVRGLQLIKERFEKICLDERTLPQKEGKRKGKIKLMSSNGIAV